MWVQVWVLGQMWIWELVWGDSFPKTALSSFLPSLPLLFLPASRLTAGRVTLLRITEGWGLHLMLLDAPLANWFESGLLRSVGGVLGAPPLFSGNSNIPLASLNLSGLGCSPFPHNLLACVERAGRGRGIFSLPAAPPQRSDCALPRLLVSLVLVQPACPSADAWLRAPSNGGQKAAPAVPGRHPPSWKGEKLQP